MSVPPKETVTHEIHGIEVVDLEDAAASLLGERNLCGNRHGLYRTCHFGQREQSRLRKRSIKRKRLYRLSHEQEKQSKFRVRNRIYRAGSLLRLYLCIFCNISDKLCGYQCVLREPDYVPVADCRGRSGHAVGQSFGSMQA